MSDHRRHSSQSDITSALDQAKKIPINILLVGDSGTGKTALVNRFLNDSAIETTKQANMTRRTSLSSEAGKVDLTVYDVQGGYNNFIDLGPTFIRKADVIFFVYDATDKDSFINLTEWIKLVQSSIDYDPHYCLVGTKTDLTDQITVDSQTATKLATLMDMPFVELSAKTGTHVQAFFQIVIDECALEKARHMSPLTIHPESSTRIESELSSRRHSLFTASELFGDEHSVTASIHRSPSITEPAIPEDVKTYIESMKQRVIDIIQAEMTDLLKRKKVSTYEALTDKHKARYDALNELTQKVDDLAREVTDTRSYQQTNWKVNYNNALNKVLDDTYKDKRIEKYSKAGKIGKKILNVISTPTAPIKRAVSDSWFYSTKGKSKEAINKAKAALNDHDKPDHKRLKR